MQSHNCALIQEDKQFADSLKKVHIQTFFCFNFHGLCLIFVFKLIQLLIALAIK